MSLLLPRVLPSHRGSPLAVLGLLSVGLSGCPTPPESIDASVPRPDVARDGYAPDAATPALPIDLVASLADPYAPARIRPGHPFLVSSRTPEIPEGLLNDDYGHFVRTADGWGVMIDRAGPGVITRWWMTIGNLPGPRDPEAVRVRFFVDDVEVDPTPSTPGVTLEELTNGSVPGLEAPFTLGREGTSGGFVVSQPLHYQRSFRAEVQLPALPSWTYYQFEGSDYEAGTEVVPFRSPPSMEQRADLESAAMLWRDHEHPGETTSTMPTSLAMGEEARLAWTGPGVATTLSFDVPRGSRASMIVIFVVDGEEVVRTPLAWLTGSAEPGTPTYSSALLASSETTASFYYPVPFARSLEVRLQNAGTATSSVALSGRVVRGALDADLGALRVDCHAGEPVPAIDECGTSNASLRTPNYVVARMSGGRGHYAGHSLVQTTTGAWWCALEVDHEINIDGAYTVLGTGMEDYYSAGFYFMNGPIAWTLAGAPGWDRTAGTSATHVYRNHLVDTIPFESELRFEYESYVSGTTFTGCSFFYLTRN